MARRPGRILFSAAGVSAIAGLTLLGCRESKTPTAATRVPATTTPQELPSPPPPFEPDAVIAGAGDIAMCGAPEVAATATLLDSIPGAVFTAGDNAYPSGGLRDFISCYEPTWGRHKGRTRPVPGNHEYETPGGAGYYQYFGSQSTAPSPLMRRHRRVNGCGRPWRRTRRAAPPRSGIIRSTAPARTATTVT
jgi:hypothetical protein